MKPHEIMTHLWSDVQEMASQGDWPAARELADAIPCKSCMALALQFIDAYELADAKIINCPTIPR